MGRTEDPDESNDPLLKSAGDLLALLIVLHIGAAVYLQFLLKDDLLSRMWYKKTTGDQ